MKQKKNTFTGILNGYGIGIHKTIEMTVMMMKLMKLTAFSFLFYFPESSIHLLAAIWHHQPLRMDIKGLRFKGTHQPFPVRLVEVKCHQFRIMWVLKHFLFSYLFLPLKYKMEMKIPFFFIKKRIIQIYVMKVWTLFKMHKLIRCLALCFVLRPMRWWNR